MHRRAEMEDNEEEKGAREAEEVGTKENVEEQE